MNSIALESLRIDGYEVRFETGYLNLDERDDSDWGVELTRIELDSGVSQWTGIDNLIGSVELSMTSTDGELFTGYARRQSESPVSNPIPSQLLSAMHGSLQFKGEGKLQ